MSDIEDDIASEDKVSFKQSSDEDEAASDIEGESENDEEGEGEMSEYSSEEETPTAVATKPSKLDAKETTKQIRSVLNKVSEGNIDPMFKELLKVVDELMPKDPTVFSQCYSDIFNQLCINHQ